MKYCAIALICFFSLGGLLSCGLEAFYYIDYIRQGDYLETRAIINLPSSSSEGYNYFDNFLIFYRIYISGELITPGIDLTAQASSEQRNLINPTLNSDYTNIYPSTDPTSTSVNTSNLENTFNNRKYYLLTLEGADINSVLGSGSLGRTLMIFFDPQNGVQPTLTINETSYVLQRTENRSGQFFQLQPDRKFLNHPDLFNNTNATAALNVDVAANSRVDSPLYTYVSMYIAAKGRSSELPPRDIYSQPTFVGIFRLTNFSN